MNDAKDAFDLMQMLKVILITVIPLGILIGIVLYFKNKTAQEEKNGVIDSEAIRKQMEEIAKQKLAQREKEQLQEEKRKLKPDEICKRIESEREDFEETELVIPLEDLENELPGEMGKPE